MQAYEVANTYSQYFEHILPSYQIALGQPVKNSSINIFYNDWQAFIEEQLPLTDQLIFARLNKIRLKGINAARVGDLVTATKCLDLVRLRYLKDRLSCQGSLIYKSLLKATESYLDYKHGNFDEARIKTFEALAIYQNLEEEFNYEIIFLRRLQLVCNLVRLEGKSMNYKRAIELACQLLNYINGNSNVLSIPGFWDYKLIENQSPDIILATYALVVGEIAEILAVKPYQHQKKLFEIISANLNFPNDQNKFFHRRAYSWLLLKRKFFKDIPEFLIMSSTWLSEGRGDIPLLWYATVIDLINLPEMSSFPGGKLFKQKVIESAQTWKNCPPHFLSLLDMDSNKI